MKLKYVTFRNEDIQPPTYATSMSAGLDLRASLPDNLVLNHGERKLVKTNFGVEIPEGYAGFIVPRSGLANQYGLSIVNTPGIIDADYRGEIHVNLINHGPTPITIHPGDRIAQLLIVQCPQVELEKVSSLSVTERSIGGHGSTGVR